MVYCGVPSKACAYCRGKRTKCDQAVPSCGQCRRAHRVCPGYRDEQSLAFRDETKQVVKKVQAAKAVKSNTAPHGRDIINGFDSVNEPESALVSIDRSASSSPWSLSMPLEEQASCFFFHHFVSDDPSTPIGYAKFLPKIYNFDSAYGSLAGVVTSIGLAGLSNLKSSPETMIIARKKHTAVLRSLNSSLQDPGTAATDATFLTVLLLGLFEMVTCTSPQSLRSWTNHIHGAKAIARIRGREQLQSPLGRQIFSYLRNQLVIDCIQRRLVVPPEIIEWSEYASELETDPGRVRESAMFPILTRLCALRAMRKSETYNDPAVLTIAKSIDADLVEWVDAIPPWLRYTTKTSDDTENVLSGFYHVYPNIWIVGGYNLYRCACILMHELIVHWLDRSSVDDLQQRQSSEAILAKLSAEICASVPCIFGQIAKNGPPNVSYSPKAATGTWVLWPLYLAATMNSATPTTRAWVITQLDRLGRIMGLQQATTLAAVLRTQKELTAWDRFGTRIDEEVNEW
ncbi:hypothetical protein JMJ35_010322 [Cladonia borealis]|uniref:Zn(2)-C6 fungal-type domain-containing protein n=1 Tax=Cladonia borealis TaxID=184061 RepID=A0AA39V1H6_9LECA|nr:hypothetical protein JMJ35_010322 [Cladonia borealis]